MGIGDYLLFFTISYSLSPIPLNGGREFYTSFGGKWFS
ncbi:hypothetical protein COO91_06503 [Nostoc flagelliforme CCNUN1]|uniref:Uncharacterized protein n=1 Tax=Nostoc flagelliforme CCNUN1 TaxID=2038116 RepID=A0A2K8SYG4_9NOSO|nr:hypothetical protein COO91_06503 [Nostoc flagelliforme CCNUN1]